MAYNNSPLMLAGIGKSATGMTPNSGFWSQANAGMRGQILYTGATNGSQIQKLTYQHTSTAAINIFVGKAVKGTLQANATTWALVSGSPVTMTRGSGSNVTDGYQVGDLVLPVGTTTIGNQLCDFVSAVASGTLTLTQNTIFTAENMPAASYLAKLFPSGVLLTAVATAAVPVQGNLLMSQVWPGTLSDANAYQMLNNAELLFVKPSRTGQGITDVTTPFATANSYLTAMVELGDF